MILIRILDFWNCQAQDKIHRKIGIPVHVIEPTYLFHGLVFCSIAGHSTVAAIGARCRAPGGWWCGAVRLHSNSSTLQVGLMRRVRGACDARYTVFGAVDLRVGRITISHCRLVEYKWT